MVISADKKNIGTNKSFIGTNRSFMHPRLATINNLMTFAGAHNNPRYVDVYDSAGRRGLENLWGNLFAPVKMARLYCPQTEVRYASTRSRSEGDV
jgi:hypothetical protein